LEEEQEERLEARLESFGRSPRTSKFPSNTLSTPLKTPNDSSRDLEILRDHVPHVWVLMAQKLSVRMILKSLYEQTAVIGEVFRKEN
jgi:hypothetical protein